MPLRVYLCIVDNTNTVFRGQPMIKPPLNFLYKNFNRNELAEAEARAIYD